MAENLPIFSDDTKLTLTDADKASVMHTLQQATVNLACFANLLDTAPYVTMDDVHTHIGLLEHHLCDLTAATKYDSVLAKQAKYRCAEIREKNQRIRELTDMLSKNITAETLTGSLRHYAFMHALNHYNNILYTAFEALGLQIKSTEFTCGKFIVDVDSEIYTSTTQQKSHDNDDFDHLCDLCKSVYHIITDAPDMTFYEEDPQHVHLTDTDVNKQRLSTLLTTVFPNSSIQGFSSHYVGDGLVLQTRIQIPFTDLETIYRQANPT